MQESLGRLNCESLLLILHIRDWLRFQWNCLRPYLRPLRGQQANDLFGTHLGSLVNISTLFDLSTPLQMV